MSFDNLQIIEPILTALKTEGYSIPTPIQAQSIPILLKGQDLQGCAQTGTGKTAAFAIPIIQHIYLQEKDPKAQRKIQALVLAPTRELAIQIGESFAAYGRHTRLRHTVIFGGVGQKPQTDALARGIDILVATPGRLLDLMGQGFIRLDDIRWFVLDEADRMLDMGMGHDVKRIIAKLPARRQSMFFSATIPAEVTKLMDSILTQPAKVAVTPVSSTIEVIGQSVYLVDTKKSKRHLLQHILLEHGADSVLVFSRTKHGANKIAGDLVKAGIQAMAIHGNKSQTARQMALAHFKDKKVRVLVATDIAARGIDVEKLALVINYDLPEVPETYVHRIGRTGRAGEDGQAISFCDPEERSLLRDIERLIKLKIPVVTEHPYLPGRIVPEEEKELERQLEEQRRQARPQPRPQGRPAPRNPRGGENRNQRPSKTAGPVEKVKRDQPSHRRPEDKPVVREREFIQPKRSGKSSTGGNGTPLRFTRTDSYSRGNR